MVNGVKDWILNGVHGWKKEVWLAKGLALRDSDELCVTSHVGWLG